MAALTTADMPRPSRGGRPRDPSRDGVIRAAILRLLAEGARPIGAMVERMYVGLDPRLVPAAARSVLAHLIDLRSRGLVMEGDATWMRR